MGFWADVGTLGWTGAAAKATGAAAYDDTVSAVSIVSAVPEVAQRPEATQRAAPDAGASESVVPMAVRRVVSDAAVSAAKPVGAGLAAGGLAVAGVLAWALSRRK